MVNVAERSEKPSGPSPARLHHGPVELSPKTVKDTHGAPAQPYWAVDTIEVLLRRGTIAREMGAAADKFREAFRAAHIDPLRAADMSRVPGNYPKPADPPAWAGPLVSETVMHLGGEGSVAASAVLFAVGLEVPVSRWSVEHAGLCRQTGA